MRSFWIAASWLLSSAVAQAAPQFVNAITVPGATTDKFGDRVGFFSDIYYDARNNEWWALADRGPSGGKESFDTRAYRFTLDIDPATGAIANFKIVATQHGIAPDNQYNNAITFP